MNLEGLDGRIDVMLDHNKGVEIEGVSFRIDLERPRPISVHFANDPVEDSVAHESVSRAAPRSLVRVENDLSVDVHVAGIGELVELVLGGLAGEEVIAQLGVHRQPDLRVSRLEVRGEIHLGNVGVGHYLAAYL